MLITSPLKPGDIVTIKFVSSEEVIAKIVEISDNAVKISKPIVLTLAGNPLMEGGLVPLPWSFSVDDIPLEIKKDKIVFMAKSRKEIVNMYMRITSNLIMPGIADSLKDVKDQKQ